ncbi:MAG: acetate--CoA ligase family protein [Desulfurococcaceae archaeon]
MITSSSKTHGAMPYKMPDHEAFELLKKYEIPFPPYGVAKDPEEAGEIAESIGYPVVIKIISPSISHKTDVGGVILNLYNKKSVIESSRIMLENITKRLPGIEITGLLIQKMVPKGVEVIIGGINDPTFGGVVMFGLGGIFTEILRDVSFKITPLSIEDAVDMITEIRASNIIKGYRNLPPVDIMSIADIIVKVSKILDENPDIESIDLNPVIAYSDHALVVDARFIIHKQTS